MKVLERFSKFAVRCGTRLVVFGMTFTLVLTSSVPGFAGTTTLKDRTYNFSLFGVQSDTAVASCAANGCKASTKMLETNAGNLEWIICLQPTCAIYAHVESDAQVSAGDTGLFTFVVTDLTTDSTLPIAPGPANPDGSVAFLVKDSDATTHYGTSASVLTTVPTGGYMLTVNVGCNDAGGGGCSALSFHSTLSVDVYSN